MKKALFFFALCLMFFATSQAKKGVIRSGEPWPDTDGQHINAHGGGILFYNGAYYWYGEHKSDTTSAAMVGVTCYRSKDLVHWKNCGVALAVSEEEGSEIERGCIIERPKVVYCPKTGKFVMWFHLELKGKGYSAARAAVATSDKATGPFTYLRSGRVNPGLFPADFGKAERQRLDTLDERRYPVWWSDPWREAIGAGLFLKRDMAGGQMSRDMTIYVDDDGRAYHIFSSEDNLTIHIAELTDDYTGHTGRYWRVAPCGQNEAPAIFRRNGRYWLITSGCTGWVPNEARMFTSLSLKGPWEQLPSPCVGENAEKTFGGQGTYILPVHGKDDAFIFMGDIWRPGHPGDARYIWLPITFEGEKPVVEWRDEWGTDFWE